MMVEHEVHVDMQVLYEDTFKQEGNQALVLVQRDYELPLGESHKYLKEEHDITTIGPENDGEDAFKILMGKSCKEVRLVHHSSLPTSISSTSIGDENLVKGFFLMLPHEEYENSISPFYDDMIRAPYSLHFQHHHLLHYDDTHLHGCTYVVHLSHLKTHDFPCLVHLMLEEIHPTLRLMGI